MADDVQVRMAPHNERFLLSDSRARNGNGQIQGLYESKRAMLEASLSLHHFHKFTRVTFTDGACDNTRPEGGNMKRRITSNVAWGEVL